VRGEPAGSARGRKAPRRMEKDPRSNAYVVALLDLDAGTAVALLRGIQRVALTLGLERRGFEISVDVLPPRQHADLMKIKIRSGEKKASSADADETDT
jgi:prolyl-tRNA editing enzyme YbaK/EbsC (Cys-tRNA(Pro) deacylase)